MGEYLAQNGAASIFRIASAVEQDQCLRSFSNSSINV